MSERIRPPRIVPNMEQIAPHPGNTLSPKELDQLSAAISAMSPHGPGDAITVYGTAGKAQIACTTLLEVCESRGWKVAASRYGVAVSASRMPVHVN